MKGKWGNERWRKRDRSDERRDSYHPKQRKIEAVEEKTRQGEEDATATAFVKRDIQSRGFVSAPV